MFDLFRNKRTTSSVEELREVHHFSETSTHSTFGAPTTFRRSLFRRSFKISEKFENHYTCDLTLSGNTPLSWKNRHFCPWFEQFWNFEVVFLCFSKIQISFSIEMLFFLDFSFCFGLFSCPRSLKGPCLKDIFVRCCRKGLTCKTWWKLTFSDN